MHPTEELDAFQIWKHPTSPYENEEPKKVKTDDSSNTEDTNQAPKSSL